MAYPQFNSFELNSGDFYAERITFKGLASREVIRAKINRREGVKLLATEFGEKQITIEGQIVASSASVLQSDIDDLKKNIQIEEGALVIEADRTFYATVTDLTISDEHYNQTKAPYSLTFVVSNPFALGTLLTTVSNVTSGVYVFSGMMNISGTMFSRPTIIYTPPSATGPTGINRIDLYHYATGQTLTISGFGSGTSLGYQSAITINLDTFTSLEGTTPINNSGAFMRWDPGNNQYRLTVSGNVLPGGTVTAYYQPRYL